MHYGVHKMGKVMSKSKVPFDDSAKIENVNYVILLISTFNSLSHQWNAAQKSMLVHVISEFLYLSSNIIDWYCRMLQFYVTSHSGHLL